MAEQSARIGFYEREFRVSTESVINSKFYPPGEKEKYNSGFALLHLRDRENKEKIIPFRGLIKH
ncbi:MAG: hypothetical protein D3904_01940 [Candidatus Electrothrix sp. EH2]|nr:hypothetical protein [Candidatus Electrothrix sp. EH2]